MADFEVTNLQLQEINLAWQAIDPSTLTSEKGIYAAVKARRRVKGAIEELEEARQSLCKLHAKKDGNGKPIMADGPEVNGQPTRTYVFEDRDAFDLAWASLLKEETTLTGVRALTLEEFRNGEDKHPYPALGTLVMLGPFLVVPKEE